MNHQFVPAGLGVMKLPPQRGEKAGRTREMRGDLGSIVHAMSAAPGHLRPQNALFGTSHVA